MSPLSSKPWFLLVNIATCHALLCLGSLTGSSPARAGDVGLGFVAPQVHRLREKTSILFGGSQGRCQHPKCIAHHREVSSQAALRLSARRSFALNMVGMHSEGEADYGSEQTAQNVTSRFVSVETKEREMEAHSAPESRREEEPGGSEQDTQQAARQPAPEQASNTDKKQTLEALRGKGMRTPDASAAQLPFGLGAREGIDTLIIGKIIIDEFVLRRQPEARIVRTGLGGGSPQAAVGARLWDRSVGVVAPVGQSFADEMLSGLEMSGIDTSGVSKLAGFVTPRNQIRYEAERMIWTPAEGWDRWEQLNAEVLPLPDSYRRASLLHVITEGGGGAEAGMVARYRAEQAVVVSLEPVVHQVSEGVVESLRAQTSLADVVSPDWDTALAISRLPPPLPLNLSGSALHPELMGRYDLLPAQHNGRPAYQLAGGNAFLYYTPSEGRWYVGPMLGSSVACMFVSSDAATPDLCRESWEEYDDASGRWVGAAEFRVARSQRSVSFTDSHGQRRRVAVRQGGLGMAVNEAGETEVTQMRYSSRHGQITVDGDVTFFMSCETRHRVARRLRSLCAAAGVPWDEDGSLKKQWEDVDSSLVVAAKRQGVWQALVDEESGGVYYWNTITDETTWTRPPEIMRLSQAQETKRFNVRNIKGDVTRLSTNQSSAALNASAGDTPPAPPLAGSPADEPGRVLVRCARQLGMTEGVLAVRRGSAGSYVLDCADPTTVWAVPAIPMSVVDPTGAGNAYSAALGANLAALGGELPRTEAMLVSACRATATGAAFVAVEGLPLPSNSIESWLREQSKLLRARVLAMPVETKNVKSQGGGPTNADSSIESERGQRF